MTPVAVGMIAESDTPACILGLKLHAGVAQTAMGVALLEGREDACPGDGSLITESDTEPCTFRPNPHDCVAFSAILLGAV